MYLSKKIYLNILNKLTYLNEEEKIYHSPTSFGTRGNHYFLLTHEQSQFSQDSVKPLAQHYNWQRTSSLCRNSATAFSFNFYSAQIQNPGPNNTIFKYSTLYQISFSCGVVLLCQRFEFRIFILYCLNYVDCIELIHKKYILMFLKKFML